LGAKAQTGAASLALYSKYTPPVLVYLLAASRRLVRGRQSWGISAGFCSGLAAVAVVPLLGLLVAASRDAKIERLRAMYKTSATPSSGLAETPSGGCGKDGFFLRLSHLLNYRNNSRRDSFLAASWGVFPHLLWIGLLRVAGGV
jgi:hypothetical protein